MASSSRILIPADKSVKNAIQTPSPAMADNGEEDMTKAILDELQREGHTSKKGITPSKKFMIDLFSSLRREEILQNKSELLLPQTQIHHSDTVRSFSAKVPSSLSRHHRRNRLFYEFVIPMLPEHEQTHVVEFRVLNSNSHAKMSPLLNSAPLPTRIIPSRRSWAVVVKKAGVRIYKLTRKYQPVQDGVYDVFDVTETVSSHLNENRGNLVIIIKERSRDGDEDNEDEDNAKEGDTSDQSSCASPGNGLLVLYSRNTHFFHDIYQRFTSGSSPAINDHRQRRHSVGGDSQRQRRPRPRQNKNRKKKMKLSEKDKQMKGKKNKGDEIPCGRYDYTIDFDVIGWGKWIVAPKSYNAYLCSGSCAFHMEAKHNSSNHAMLRSLMKLKQPDITPMPCCVPTKLKPISMMYFELGEIVVRKHQDVIAEQCGCR